MDDNQIIELYFDKNEQAIKRTKEKYSAYLTAISYNILGSKSDCEEVENDAYLALWNAIPPLVPKSLKAYLARVVRNLSLKRVEKKSAKKRDSDLVLLSEIKDELSSDDCVFEAVEAKELGQEIDAFLQTQNTDDKNAFVLRYFSFYSYKDIADRLSCSEGKVKMSVLRTKQKLMEVLNEKYR